ncbi:MAG: leucyl/phenylalanyl-tRNA--protein transferase [Deltaproteobacteria bacterium]|nr:leucyl/phenylalanyl-tRNA--protein transferase [Deltaproteobacteria bacterium]
MPVFQLDNRLIFPEPRHARPDGLLAVGGDLCAARLLLAYSMGIFPWYNEAPILWWSPPQRCVLEPERLIISRKLAQTARNRFTVTVDRCFGEVIHACAVTPRKRTTNSGEPGTWIGADMERAYTGLFERGYAHSVECWRDGQLAGGLYGILLGRCFCGESMFHRASDASKVALVHLAAFLQKSGGGLIDCQISNPHLASLGAHDISRGDYLRRLRALGVIPGVVQKPVPLCTA